MLNINELNCSNINYFSKCLAKNGLLKYSYIKKLLDEYPNLYNILWQIVNSSIKLNNTSEKLVIIYLKILYKIKEEEIISYFKTNNKEALFEIFKPLVFITYSRNYNSQINKDDFLQSAYLGLFEAISYYKSSDLNSFITCAKKSINTAISNLPGNQLPNLDNVYSSDRIVEDTVINSLLKDYVDRSLMILTPRKREILRLYFEEQQSIKDISTIYNLSDKRIRDIIKQSLRLIRENKKHLLEGYYESEEKYIIPDKKRGNNLGFFAYFPSHEVLDLITTLSEEEKRYLYLRYGNNLDSLLEVSTDIREKAIKVVRKLQKNFYNKNKTISKEKKYTLENIANVDKLKFLELRSLLLENIMLYDLFSKVFGNNLLGYENISNLTQDEKDIYKEYIMQIHTNIDYFMAEFFSPPINKTAIKSNYYPPYFRYVANMLPKSYRYIILLKLGLLNGTIYNFLEISQLLDLSIEDVKYLYDEGLIIYQELLNDYNKKYGLEQELKLERVILC